MTEANPTPLPDLDSWEDFVEHVYAGGPGTKAREDYRNYDDPARSSVREFYRLNHAHQTYAFVQQKREEFLSLDRARMTPWEALDFLDEVVDDSDPDTSLTQLQHLLQTSEAIRNDGHPDWFVLTGFLHDLGKVLCLWGEPQWAVVGDTFPVGCAFSDKVVYPEYFAANPDVRVQEYQTELGIYEEGGGLDAVTMSWGHDEYLYHVLKDHLPEPGLYMIRYHSFYACHREGAYQRLMNARDREMFAWVRAFNPYDLYSKTDVPPDTEALRPYYDDLLGRYLPETLRL